MDTANLLEYHKSLAAELESIKSRVRNLVPHKATDGAFKESMLRLLLRRYLPEPLFIGTGFILDRKGQASTQIDLLIVDRSCPFLFQDGDLLVVTPPAVRGIVEVKTSLSGPKKIHDALAKIAKCRVMCTHNGGGRIVSGLFVYDSAQTREVVTIQQVQKMYQKKAFSLIDVINYGVDVIGMKGGRTDAQWSVWRSPGLSPAYFVSLLLHGLLEHHGMWDPEVWFPEQPDNRLLYFLDQDWQVCKGTQESGAG